MTTPSPKRRNGTSKSIQTANDLVSNIETELLKQQLGEYETRSIALSETVQQLLTKIEDKDAEINHLLSLLQYGKDVQIINPNNVTKIEVSDEEQIAEYQLYRLKEKAVNQELTLEEVKKFDLLVKNKRLAQGNATIIPDYKKLTNETSKKELLKLAAFKDVVNSGGNDDNDSAE